MAWPCFLGSLHSFREVVPQSWLCVKNVPIPGIRVEGSVSHRGQGCASPETEGSREGPDMRDSLLVGAEGLPGRQGSGRAASRSVGLTWAAGSWMKVSGQRSGAVRGAQEPRGWKIGAWCGRCDHTRMVEWSPKQWSARQVIGGSQYD